MQLRVSDFTNSKQEILMKKLVLACAGVLALFVGPVHSQEKGVQSEIIFWIADAEKKLTALAEAMPAEKYGWRPMEGVRSVSEVYMHTVVGNFNIPRLIGIDPPIQLESGIEITMKDKAKIIELMKQSFEHAKKAVMEIPVADLDKMTKIFRGEGTQRQVLLLLATHSHEHLGQSIAYARMNGVAPPWSVRQE